MTDATMCMIDPEITIVCGAMLGSMTMGDFGVVLAIMGVCHLVDMLDEWWRG
jgi:hypothetical protein